MILSCINSQPRTLPCRYSRPTQQPQNTCDSLTYQHPTKLLASTPAPTKPQPTTAPERQAPPARPPARPPLPPRATRAPRSPRADRKTPRGATARAASCPHPSPPQTAVFVLVLSSRAAAARRRAPRRTRPRGSRISCTRPRKRRRACSGLRGARAARGGPVFWISCVSCGKVGKYPPAHRGPGGRIDSGPALSRGPARRAD